MSENIDITRKRHIFHQAARNGDVVTIRRMLGEGLAIDIADMCGETALIKASFSGQLQAVQILLEKGANVDACDRRLRQTALIRASRIGNGNIVGLLLCYNANKDYEDHQRHTALIKAAMNNHLDCVRKLVRSGAILNRVDESGSTALMKAAHIGNDQIVSTLIDARAILNVTDNNGNTALMKAVAWGHIECVRLLVHAGADIARDILVKIMVNWYPGMNRSEEQLDRDFQCVRALCKTTAGVTLDQYRVDINAVDNRGETPLMHAAAIGHEACALFLLKDMHADIHKFNDSGQTALMIAAKYGHREIIKICLREGARVNLADMAGHTAIMHAAFYDHPSCVEDLAMYDADPNVVDTYRWTPLMHMSINGHLHCVKALKRAGALVDQKNVDGDSAYHLAKRHNHQDIYLELIE